MQKCGNKAPKTVKIWIFVHKFAPSQEQLVCTILKKFLAFVRVYSFQIFNQVVFGGQTTKL